MPKPSRTEAAHAASESNVDRLLDLPNVSGVGVGNRVRNGHETDEVCVHVFVERKMPVGELSSIAIVPESIPGPEGHVKTDVVELRNVTAHQDTGRYRPIPGGCSIGPEASISAGTLGGFACDNDDDTIVLLTNNHVISGLDNLPTLRRVLQPGRLDGGVLPDDVIGTLKRHAQVNTVPNPGGGVPPVSVVDAAISTLDDVRRTDNIRQLNVPAIYEIQAPAQAMAVQKRGRTTQLTTNGTIFSTGVTINITYRNQTRLGRVQNSFVIRSTDGNVFSAAGDSGSLILNQTAGSLNGTFPVVGLLYGGATFNDGTPATIANNINAVFGALNLTTVCACVARALIRAIFGSNRVEDSVNDRLVRYKEVQLKRFRWNVLDAGRFGGTINNVISREAGRVGQILNEDEEAFGLLVRALRPWVIMPTNLDIMEARFDDETIDNLTRFAKRVARRNKELAAQFAAVQAILESIRGATVGQVLRSTKYNLDPEGPRKHRKV